MNSDFLPRHGKRLNKYETVAQHPATHRPIAVHSDDEASFRTPEEVAADDDRQDTSTDTSDQHAQSAGQDSQEEGAAMPEHKPKQSLKDRIAYKLKHLTRKQWIIIAVVAVLIIGGGAVGAYAMFHKTPKPAPAKKAVVVTKTIPKPIQPVSNLTGLNISDPNINNLPVTAIMIENSVDARPQSGLNDAGVVFEAVAEGGITRFLTLWQDTAPSKVGPVRSVRPYYLQWLQGFDAPVAHVGGSGDALRLIKQWNIKDLDQFYNPAPYWRASDRYAPHNMYTDVNKLHDLESQKGFGKSSFTGFARKTESPAANVTARTIDFSISGAVYNSHYDYNPADNSYMRSEGGSPHKDANTGAQINPKVVVGLVMDQGQNGIYTTYNTIGSGKAYVFQDGTVTEGTWNKSDNASQFVFKDANGNEIKLDAGRTWLTVVGSSNDVSYKP